MIYELGDLFIFQKVENFTVTISDTDSYTVILWLYFDFMNDFSNLWMKVLASALLIGAWEWFFHNLLLNQEIVYDEHKRQ
ncbi:hypothetical protein RV14_GL001071 [Enterococcus ratti]|uniref:Uncharacterized protein n=1 Tax=Enterococcus ratti TaxID=150033 RepID=A0A1L8WD19_9ENTE|nr:hypothetical protein RV14_GL001071 [Enterococcus ratti]